MPKRNDSLATLLAHLPWWAHLLLAPLAYAFVAGVVPALLGAGAVARLFAPVYNLLGIVVAGTFVLGAGRSFVAARRRRRLLDRQTGLGSIRALSWREFERLVAEAYRRAGYRVLENEGLGPDGGIDLRLRKHGALHLVQCKNWRSRRVGVRVVREVYGVLAAEDAWEAEIVCSGGFTEDARRFAAGKPIRLVDGEALLDLVRGVQPSGGVPRSPEPAHLGQSNAQSDCPRCGGRLVERTAKRGARAGSRFLGCETYPRCRHTEDLPGS